jgi:hypothetical protein
MMFPDRLLLAQYGGKAVIRIEDVCRDYFSHLDPGKFIRKVTVGELKFPWSASKEVKNARRVFICRILPTTLMSGQPQLGRSVSS